MFTVAEMLSLPPGRALLGGVTQDRTGLTDRYTLELDFLFPQTAPAAAGAPEFGVHLWRTQSASNGDFGWSGPKGR